MYKWIVLRRLKVLEVDGSRKSGSGTILRLSIALASILNEPLYIYNIRKKRIHPLKDDKILTDWNGLIIAALSKAGSVFQKNEYIQVAKKASDFLIKNMMKKEGKILHRYRNKKASISGFADDYAFTIMGFIELYEATFDVKYLQYAMELNNYLIKYFWNEENKGFNFTSKNEDEILMQTREIYDGAIPSSNSEMTLNLLRLGRLTGNNDFEEKASQILNSFSSTINDFPTGYTNTLIALDFSIGPSYEIIIVGGKNIGKSGRISAIEKRPEQKRRSIR